MEDCIFCKIVAKKIPADIQYEDDHMLVFKDIHPKAPVHWLVVPKIHIESLQALLPEHVELIGKLLLMVPQLSKKSGIAESGYKVFTNIGKHGEQVVPHLHFHLMGGEPLHGPTRV